MKETVLNLIGACCFPVTAYGKYLQIGCELYTFAEWKKLLKMNDIQKKFGLDDKDFELCVAAGKYCEYVLNTK